jgi:hypothetical protein
MSIEDLVCYVVECDECGEECSRRLTTREAAISSFIEFGGLLASRLVDREEITLCKHHAEEFLKNSQNST